MKAAIIYKSLTGNTKLVAEAIREALQEQVVYCGEPKDKIEADVYFIGSWTDKGICCKEIAAFLNTLEDRKIAYFGTAGFSGSKEYYQAIFERVKSLAPASHEWKNCFFCQGKMPMSVRERYVAMLTEHPDDKKHAVSVKNFDEALQHPDEDDLEAAKVWAQSCLAAE